MFKITIQTRKPVHKVSCTHTRDPENISPTQKANPAQRGEKKRQFSLRSSNKQRGWKVA